MNKIKYFGMMIALLFSALSFNACSSDDDEVSIDSYLKGKWHSYKAVVSAQNQSVDLEVTKTGQYSQFYYEAVFKDGNKVDMSYYKVDDNTASRWETETGSYSVNGDVITVYDEEGAIDFFFNPKEKNMYMRVAGEVENIGYTTVFLYFRK
jgi:hypothetical protein